MRFSLTRITLYGVLATILFLLPVFVKSVYVMHIINMSLIYIIVVSGLNIIMGYCGQFALAHSAFYGVGAYTSAILSTRFGISFWICLPAAVIASCIAGFLTSLPCLKVKGHYLAMVSLGLGIVIHEAMVNLENLTNGAAGIINIPPPFLFGVSLDTDHRYYPIILVFTILSILFVKSLLRFKVGRAFIAIRESYTAAEAMGINHRFFKVQGFVLSASYAGLAGSLYVHLVKFVSPDSFGLGELITEFAMLIVGGVGTLGGPVLGAIILSFAYEYLRALHSLQMITYGVMILLFVLFMPRGLVTIKDWVFALRKGAHSASSG